VTARYKEDQRRLRRFFFYSHDGLGLGHVRRNLSLASAIVELDVQASVLVATSADEAEELGIPPRVDLLKLPGLRKVTNGRYAARRLPVSWRDVRSLRARLLLAAVSSFRPAVLLADKHPLGVGRELEPALKEARAAGARAVLGLRDILDAPRVVRAEWSKRGLYERVLEYYDRVLVYGQADLFDPRRKYGFPDRLAAITSFCGYVRAPLGEGDSNGDPRPRPTRTRVRPRVLATSGGGEDGFEILAAFLESAAQAPWQASVVAGPHSDPGDGRRLQELATAADVAFERFVPGLSIEFQSLDALVCMGGYNTLVEAVACEVPTVCVPRSRPRSEQLIRARAFAQRGLVRLVEPVRLDAANLTAEVEHALAAPKMLHGRAVRALDLEGARRAAGQLLELAHEAEGAAAWSRVA
jgi:predicted glycosyltransferase